MIRSVEARGRPPRDAHGDKGRPKRTAVVPYTELHCHSAFSFLDGASTPEQLVAEALRQELSGLAITDHDGCYGIVRFAEAARDTGLKTVYGAELSLGMPEPQLGVPDPVGEHLLVIARGQEGYRLLSRQIASAQLAGGEKGRPIYDIDRVASAAGDNWLILTGCRKGSVRRALSRGRQDAARAEIVALMDRFGRDNVAVELTRHLTATDDEDNDALAWLAADLGLPVVATTGAHYADPEAARLGAAMAAVRARRSLAEADPYLPAGPGAHLRSGAEMAHLFRRYPSAVPNAAALGEECAFDLHLVAPELPPYDVPDGHDENSYLHELTMQGARRRYGDPDTNPKAYAQIDKELKIIEELNFPGYFLVVRDITEFCRDHDILCQGRGSAANSAVCYALGITAVDAVRYELLFERFLAPEREGPPDIDVDIESDRREEVIQHVYAKYGREYAAQVANVNTYRPRMAVRDMAKALGHSPGQQDAYSKQLDGWSPLAAQAAQAGQQAQASQQQAQAAQPAQASQHAAQAAKGTQQAQAVPAIGDNGLGIPADVLALAEEIQDFPRHLGIHSGGMVICDRPVAEVCPVEWARMENRTVLQWDKDDCAAIGLVKFDLLGLGMLSALHYAKDLVAEHEDIEIDFAQLDLANPEVYEMLQRADSVGVFQVESRAQMATLPRLKPERFYDLVVEVALIRPGPIQGGSVHPYIKRRNGEKWDFDHPSMERALGKTLGIPLFQEQLMELAVDVAGFNAGEADRLRRAMGSKRSTARMAELRDRLYDGMRRLHGITGDLADSIYERLQAFANFGFAESHALSFASLVFYSAYLKLYHPAAFCAALLRAQPMGFYSPQSLISDARRHGVTVRHPDINLSSAQSGLEQGPDRTDTGNVRPAVRLGLSEVRGIGLDLAKEIVDARPSGGYSSLESLTSAVTLTASQAEALATSGALDGLRAEEAESPMPTARVPAARRSALWAAGAAAGLRQGMLPGSLVGMDAPTLPGMSDIELTIADVWATGMSPDAYPTEFTRAAMNEKGVVTAAGLYHVEHGTRVLVAGMVTHRQRPATASGVIFINLEDETGMINVICSVGLWARYRQVARGAPSLLIRGVVERDGGALSIVADRIAAIDMVLAMPSRDFR
jgi:error-prone DNA polymerase